MLRFFVISIPGIRGMNGYMGFVMMDLRYTSGLSKALYICFLVHVMYLCFQSDIYYFNLRIKLIPKLKLKLFMLSS